MSIARSESVYRARLAERPEIPEQQPPTPEIPTPELERAVPLAEYETLLDTISNELSNEPSPANAIERIRQVYAALPPEKREGLKATASEYLEKYADAYVTPLPAVFLANPELTPAEIAAGMENAGYNSISSLLAVRVPTNELEVDNLLRYYEARLRDIPPEKLLKTLEGWQYLARDKYPAGPTRDKFLAGINQLLKSVPRTAQPAIRVKPAPTEPPPTAKAPAATPPPPIVRPSEPPIEPKPATAQAAPPESPEETEFRGKVREIFAPLKASASPNDLGAALTRVGEQYALQKFSAALTPERTAKIVGDELDSIYKELPKANQEILLPHITGLMSLSRQWFDEIHRRTEKPAVPTADEMGIQQVAEPAEATAQPTPSPTHEIEKTPDQKPPPSAVPVEQGQPAERGAEAKAATRTEVGQGQGAEAISAQQLLLIKQITPTLNKEIKKQVSGWKYVLERLAEGHRDLLQLFSTARNITARKMGQMILTRAREENTIAPSLVEYVKELLGKLAKPESPEADPGLLALAEKVQLSAENLERIAPTQEAAKHGARVAPKAARKEEEILTERSGPFIRYELRKINRVASPMRLAPEEVEKLPDDSIVKLAFQYINELRAKKQEKTGKKATAKIRVPEESFLHQLFVEWPALATKRVGELTQGDWEEYLRWRHQYTSRLDKPKVFTASDGTLRQERAKLIQFLHYINRTGHLDPSALSGVKVANVYRKQSHQSRIVPPFDDLVKLIEAVRRKNPEAGFYTALMIFTGRRQDEVINLTWNDIVYTEFEADVKDAEGKVVGTQRFPALLMIVKQYKQKHAGSITKGAKAETEYGVLRQSPQYTVAGDRIAVSEPVVQSLDVGEYKWYTSQQPLYFPLNVEARELLEARFAEAFPELAAKGIGLRDARKHLSNEQLLSFVWNPRQAGIAHGERRPLFNPDVTGLVDINGVSVNDVALAKWWDQYQKTKPQTEEEAEESKTGKKATIRPYTEILAEAGAESGIALVEYNEAEDSDFEDDFRSRPVSDFRSVFSTILAEAFKKINYPDYDKIPGAMLGHYSEKSSKGVTGPDARYIKGMHEDVNPAVVSYMQNLAVVMFNYSMRFHQRQIGGRAQRIPEKTVQYIHAMAQLGAEQTQPAAEPAPPTPHIPARTSSKLATAAEAGKASAPPVNTLEVSGIGPVRFTDAWVPLKDDLKVWPNFKYGADPETGVVPHLRLGGKYQAVLGKPILVWQRTNGEMFVISGRHSFDLAKRSKAAQIHVRIVYEADGVTPEVARILDVQSNLIEGQTFLADFTYYVRESLIPGVIRELQASGVAPSQQRIEAAVREKAQKYLYDFAHPEHGNLAAAAVDLALYLDEETYRVWLNQPRLRSGEVITKPTRIVMADGQPKILKPLERTGPTGEPEYYYLTDDVVLEIARQSRFDTTRSKLGFVYATTPNEAGKLPTAENVRDMYELLDRGVVQVQAQGQPDQMNLLSLEDLTLVQRYAMAFRHVLNGINAKLSALRNILSGATRLEDLDEQDLQALGYDPKSSSHQIDKERVRARIKMYEDQKRAVNEQRMKHPDVLATLQKIQNGELRVREAKFSLGQQGEPLTPTEEKELRRLERKVRNKELLTLEESQRYEQLMNRAHVGQLFALTPEEQAREMELYAEKLNAEAANLRAQMADWDMKVGFGLVTAASWEAQRKETLRQIRELQKKAAKVFQLAQQIRSAPPPSQQDNQMTFFNVHGLLDWLTADRSGKSIAVPLFRFVAGQDTESEFLGRLEESGLEAINPKLYEAIKLLLESDILESFPGLRLEIVSQLALGAAGVAEGNLLQVNLGAAENVLFEEFYHHVYESLSGADQEAVHRSRMATIRREIRMRLRGLDKLPPEQQARRLQEVALLQSLMTGEMSTKQFLRFLPTAVLQELRKRATPGTVGEFDAILNERSSGQWDERAAVGMDLYHLINDSEYFSWAFTRHSMQEIRQLRALSGLIAKVKTALRRLALIIRAYWQRILGQAELARLDLIWERIWSGNYDYDAKRAEQIAARLHTDRYFNLFDLGGESPAMTNPNGEIRLAPDPEAESLMTLYAKATPSEKKSMLRRLLAQTERLYKIATLVYSESSRASQMVERWKENASRLDEEISRQKLYKVAKREAENQLRLAAREWTTLGFVRERKIPFPNVFSDDAEINVIVSMFGDAVPDWLAKPPFRVTRDEWNAWLNVARQRFAAAQLNFPDTAEARSKFRNKLQFVLVERKARRLYWAMERLQRYQRVLANYGEIIGQMDRSLQSPGPGDSVASAARRIRETAENLATTFAPEMDRLRKEIERLSAYEGVAARANRYAEFQANKEVWRAHRSLLESGPAETILAPGTRAYRGITLIREMARQLKIPNADTWKPESTMYSLLRLLRPQSAQDLENPFVDVYSLSNAERIADLNEAIKYYNEVVRPTLLNAQQEAEATKERAAARLQELMQEAETLDMEANELTAALDYLARLDSGEDMPEILGESPMLSQEDYRLLEQRASAIFRFLGFLRERLGIRGAMQFLSDMRSNPDVPIQFLPNWPAISDVNVNLGPDVSGVSLEEVIRKALLASNDIWRLFSGVIANAIYKDTRQFIAFATSEIQRLRANMAEASTEEMRREYDLAMEDTRRRMQEMLQDKADMLPRLRREIAIEKARIAKANATIEFCSEVLNDPLLEEAKHLIYLYVNNHEQVMILDHDSHDSTTFVEFSVNPDLPPGAVTMYPKLVQEWEIHRARIRPVNQNGFTFAPNQLFGWGMTADPIAFYEEITRQIEEWFENAETYINGFEYAESLYKIDNGQSYPPPEYYGYDSRTYLGLITARNRSAQFLDVAAIGRNGIGLALYSNMMARNMVRLGFFRQIGRGLISMAKTLWGHKATYATVDLANNLNRARGMVRKALPGFALLRANAMRSHPEITNVSDYAIHILMPLMVAYGRQYGGEPLAKGKPIISPNWSWKEGTGGQTGWQRLTVTSADVEFVTAILDLYYQFRYHITEEARSGRGVQYREGGKLYVRTAAGIGDIGMPMHLSFGRQSDLNALAILWEDMLRSDDGILLETDTQQPEVADEAQPRIVQCRSGAIKNHRFYQFWNARIYDVLAHILDSARDPDFRLVKLKPHMKILEMAMRERLLDGRITPSDVGNLDEIAQQLFSIAKELDEQAQIAGVRLTQPQILSDLLGELLLYAKEAASETGQGNQQTAGSLGLVAMHNEFTMPAAHFRFPSSFYSYGVISDLDLLQMIHRAVDQDFVRAINSLDQLATEFKLYKSELDKLSQDQRHDRVNQIFKWAEFFPGGYSEMVAFLDTIQKLKKDIETLAKEYETGISGRYPSLPGEFFVQSILSKQDVSIGNMFLSPILIYLSLARINRFGYLMAALQTIPITARITSALGAMAIRPAIMSKWFSHFPFAGVIRDLMENWFYRYLDNAQGVGFSIRTSLREEIKRILAEANYVSGTTEATRLRENRLKQVAWKVGRFSWSVPKKIVTRVYDTIGTPAVDAAINIAAVSFYRYQDKMLKRLAREYGQYVQSVRGLSDDALKKLDNPDAQFSASNPLFIPDPKLFARHITKERRQTWWADIMAFYRRAGINLPQLLWDHYRLIKARPELQEREIFETYNYVPGQNPHMARALIAALIREWNSGDIMNRPLLREKAFRILATLMGYTSHFIMVMTETLSYRSVYSARWRGYARLLIFLPVFLAVAALYGQLSLWFRQKYRLWLFGQPERFVTIFDKEFYESRDLAYRSLMASIFMAVPLYGEIGLYITNTVVRGRGYDPSNRVLIGSLMDSFARMVYGTFIMLKDGQISEAYRPALDFMLRWVNGARELTNLSPEYRMKNQYFAASGLLAMQFEAMGLHRRKPSQQPTTADQYGYNRIVRDKLVVAMMTRDQNAFENIRREYVERKSREMLERDRLKRLTPNSARINAENAFENLFLALHPARRAMNNEAISLEEFRQALDRLPQHQRESVMMAVGAWEWANRYSRINAKPFIEPRPINLMIPSFLP